MILTHTLKIRYSAVLALFHHLLVMNDNAKQKCTYSDDRSFIGTVNLRQGLSPCFFFLSVN